MEWVKEWHRCGYRGVHPSDTMQIDNEESPQDAYHNAMFEHQVMFFHGNDRDALADREFGVTVNERTQILEQGVGPPVIVNVDLEYDGENYHLLPPDL